MAASSSRMSWIDFAKGLLMILVFVYHSEVIYGNGHSWSWLFEMFFLTGFFTLSGYLFTADLEKVSLRRKALQTLRGIVIPYFIFVGALLLPKVILVSSDSFQSIVDFFLFRSSWFVNVIAMLTLLYGSIFAISSNKKWALFIITIIGIITTNVFSIQYDNQNDLLMSKPFWNSSQISNHMPFCINLTCIAIPFYSLGIFYRSYEKIIAITCNIFSLILVWILYFFLISIDHSYIHTKFTFSTNTINHIPLVYLYSIIAIWGIVILSKLVCEIKVINYIGQNSIIFYFLNALMLRVVSILVSGCCIMKSGGYFSVILVALLAVALTFPVVWAIKKYLPFVVGDKETFNNLSQRMGLMIKW